MAMENIVRLEDLAAVVESTLEEINRGVFAARQKGILVDLPKEIQFSMIVVKEFQALELQGSIVTEGTDAKGSTSDERTTGAKTSNERNDGEEAHDQQDEEEYTYGG